MLSDEMRLKLMRLLESNPSASQREVAREFGISVGKVNYCLQALVQRGWVKVNRFRNSRNKSAYRYLLTPRGIEAKAALTVRFLRIKVREYETLRTEIEQLRREARHDLLLECRKHGASKLLRSIPWLGPIRVALLLAQVQTPHRFRSKRQFWAYCGLALETRSSAAWIWLIRFGISEAGVGLLER